MIHEPELAVVARSGANAKGTTTGKGATSSIRAIVREGAAVRSGARAALWCVVSATLLAALVAGRSASAKPTTTLRRFALVVGSNNGGRDRVLLRYATTDASRVARVLRDLGGVATEDVALLVEPDRSALERSFEVLAARMAGSSAGARREVVFYYSGHSDEEGLLLGGARFEYATLRTKLAAVPAEVRVAIVDSCASGALVRRKGGVRRPPFLLDSSADIAGTAILTSSSADEASQESDRIGGSFFTHFLLSGLRGAADVSRDRRVTLNEAYQFAFQETLARTERTASGAQHAAYDMQLAGAGDLVLTDLRGTAASLVLAEDVQGRLFVRDAAGRLVAELRKSGDRVIELGLDPGEYEITLENQGRVSATRLRLVEGRSVRLEATLLRSTPIEPTVARGEAGEPAVTSTAAADESLTPISISLLPPLSFGRG
ncbi:MAG: caspase family protein, partial [Pseudomonadota bacterium]